MSEIKELKHDIATSLFIMPCGINELLDRTFLENKSEYGVSILIQMLEQDGAIYYKGEVMHVKKSWAKKYLKDRGLDFRTEREKYIDSLTPFDRKVYGLK